MDKNGNREEELRNGAEGLGPRHFPGERKRGATDVPADVSDFLREKF